jgi:hypothetical protein
LSRKNRHAKAEKGIQDSKDTASLLILKSIHRRTSYLVPLEFKLHDPNTMMISKEEPEQLSTTGIQVHHEQVNVVTYDEEPPLQEVQAFAVDADEGFTTQQPPPPQNFAAQQSPNHPPTSSPPLTPNPTTPRSGEAGAAWSFELLLCGDSTLHRLPPGHNVSISLLSNTTIDIRDSPPLTAPVNVWILRLIGNVRMLVRPGTEVVVRRLLLCGNRDVQVEPAEQDDDNTNTTVPPPRITLNILSLCGNVRVRSNRDDM